jgi:tetratricopeptide (TPR) repeat protein
MATGLACWYLRVWIPSSRWYNPLEAGRRLMSQGRFDQAERQFGLAVAAARQLGEDDPRLGTSLGEQADALVAQERFAEAIPLFEHALEIDEKALGSDDPRVARLLEHYAASLRKAGHTSRALVVENRLRGIRARLAPGKS